MKKIVCVTMALLLLLTGCTTQTTSPLPTESFTQGIYEFTFVVEQTTGDLTDEWEFIYTYNGETITNGHQILFPLEIFTFHSIQVDISEKTAPDNTYLAAFPVAICDGGSGKTEVSVTSSDGKTATVNIRCQVARVGIQ